MANSPESREEPPGRGTPRADAPRADAWEHLAYCPNCGARLEKRQCKARCLRCGFFQDCSDTIV
jgi:hypothetical protein